MCAWYDIGIGKSVRSTLLLFAQLYCMMRRRRELVALSNITYYNLMGRGGDLFSEWSEVDSMYMEDWGSSKVGSVVGAVGMGVLFVLLLLRIAM